MKLPCPSRIDDTNVVAFINGVQRFEDTQELCIDFTTITFAEPFASLLLAESVMQLVRERRQRGLLTVPITGTIGVDDPPGLSYLKHVGFFRFVGLEVGNPPNAPRLGNSNYLPIRLLKEEDLQVDTKGKVIQDAIERESYNMASMLVDRESPDCEMLVYCFREIVRNTFEHANINYCTIMAQKWNTGWVAGDVEIAIIDRGRGILESMREAYEVESPEHAIHLALQPGVSRVKKFRPADKWGNSGYGLHVISSVGVHYGEFVICSSGKMLRLIGDQATLRDVAFTGTAIKLRANMRHAEYFPNFLEQTVRRGEEEAFQQTGERRSASQKSKVL